MEYIPRQVSNSDVKDTTIDHTNVAESFIHLATAAPTTAEDEGTGYAVGCIWVDYSNGETYVCTASTDEDATWLAQDGSDDVNPPFKIQGSTSGFSYSWSDATSYPGVIDAYSFSSDGDATDHGETVQGSYTSNGSIRTTDHAYQIGAINGPGVPGAGKSSIYRWSFTSPASSADIGEHSLAPTYGTAIGAIGGATDGTYGFGIGGAGNPPASEQHFDQVEKFTLASPAPSSDSGAELSSARGYQHGCSDNSNGYMYSVAGDRPGGNVIERGAFSISSGTFTDWGDTSAGVEGHAGSASVTNGYRHGGHSPYVNVIENFPFSSPGNASDVGDLTSASAFGSGSSSTTHGYRAGGKSSEPTITNIIDKYSHPAGGNATDVGNLSSISNGGGGTEV